MITTNSSSIFPCENCTHRGICKYEDDVMSFVRCAKLPEQECLSIRYDCKYKTSTNLFGGYGNFELNKISDTTNNGTTFRPYTINTSSECTDKI